jgi:hypothetical protein
MKITSNSNGYETSRLSARATKAFHQQIKGTVTAILRDFHVNSCSQSPPGERALGRQICYAPVMTKDQVKEILDRVLTWQKADQEKVVRFVRQVEQRRADDDITEEEWRIIEERAARRDLADDEEVEAVFSRYRNA